MNHCIKIEPLYISNLPDYITNLLIKMKPGNVPETMSFIEKTWKKYDPDRPFEYTFLDESYDRQYRNEEKLSSIFSYFTGIAILIACIGLFGMASFMAELRTKEIGIRKTFGASAPEILTLLSKEFLKWVVIANVIAWPLAWYGIYNWLQNFPYHTDIHLEKFIISGLLSLTVAFLTVSYQTIRAARSKPIDALRYE